MTIVEIPETTSQGDKDIISWIFSQIGAVKILNGELFDCGSTLMASLATLSFAVDGILDGCVAEGMRRAEASEMTAQCLLGLAKMLQDGHHPAVLRESMASPRGCTIQSLLSVEKASVRHAFAESIIAGT
ncbi:pyrroline-5-carboxylate reductase dimerization-domain-containing protein [Aspergillus oleicola]